MSNPASGEDPFAFLGLPRRFDLDSASITRAWLMRSADVHPDRQEVVSDAAREMARLNTAREALVDPERRANTLLVLLGGPTKEQDKSLPDGFLQQTLELREEIEEVLAHEQPGERARLERWAHEQRNAYITRVAALFAKVDTSAAKEDLKSIRTQLNAWRYVERLIEQLDPAHNPAQADLQHD